MLLLQANYALAADGHKGVTRKIPIASAGTPAANRISRTPAETGTSMGPASKTN